MPESAIAAAIDDYPAHRDVDPSELGLESLATLQLAIRLTGRSADSRS